MLQEKRRKIGHGDYIDPLAEDYVDSGRESELPDIGGAIHGTWNFICGEPCKHGSKLNDQGKPMCSRPVRNKGGKCNWHQRNTRFYVADKQAQK